MKQHFVTFFSPGTFLQEETVKPINSWDIDCAVKMSRKVVERYNAKPFAFQFSTRSRTAVELDSKIVKESGRYFLGGRLLTLSDVKKEMPDEQILIANMIGNRWDRVVVNTNSWKIIQRFEKGDVILAV